jgi:hypothetical protein
MPPPQERNRPTARSSDTIHGGHPMRNPWLSLWLSAANSWTGTLRGLWMA